MLPNKEIARKLNLLGKLMELHGESPFRYKTYYSAYNSLRRIEKPFAETSDEELLQLPGVGKTVVEKIRQSLDSGTIDSLEKLMVKTPPGVVDMLSIRGLGPKKVSTIWQDMGIEDISDLLYACLENRLVDYKGFGIKTQEEIRKNVEFFMDAKGSFHYPNVRKIGDDLMNLITVNYPNDLHAFIGEFGRKMPVVTSIDILTTADIQNDLPGLDRAESGSHIFEGIPVRLERCQKDNFGSAWLGAASAPAFLTAIGFKDEHPIATLKEALVTYNISGIPDEFRESARAVELMRSGRMDSLISIDDVRGVIHNHSTYSDGLHSLREMRDAVKSKGYQYLVISDHSRTAVYARGLEVERVYQQWDEIDKLNNDGHPVKIFKGIESDILGDGSLDYPEEVLAGFDLVIASVHSNLKMDETTANQRLIKAIENPYTRILGHPTGRLLLGRSGYPIDHRKVIDAAAANDVVIELNANPHRLDLDWTWIEYAQDKGVGISINPDAHSVDQIDYIPYGVTVARKGGLLTENCLNAKTTQELEIWIENY